MSLKSPSIIILILIIGLLLTSCEPIRVTVTTNPELYYTEAAYTIQVAQTIGHSGYCQVFGNNSLHPKYN